MAVHDAGVGQECARKAERVQGGFRDVERRAPGEVVVWLEVRVDSRVTETFKGQEEQLLPAMRRAGRLLLGIQDDTPGGLALSGPEPEASVFLDDQAVGLLPLPPIPDLTHG